MIRSRRDVTSVSHVGYPACVSDPEGVYLGAHKGEGSGGTYGSLEPPRVVATRRVGYGRYLHQASGAPPTENPARARLPGNRAEALMCRAVLSPLPLMAFSGML